MATPHDTLFRQTFGDPAHAGPLLRCLLPQAVVAAIDWTTLRRAPDTRFGDDQHEHRSDLWFAVRWRGR